MKALLDSQDSAIDKLRALKVGALFMEAGTGKTRSAMELVKSAEPDYVLWITPFQTRDSLRVEIDKWGGLNCEIVGAETLSSSDRVYLDLFRKLESSQRAFIVMDESLKIKNHDAKRTRRIIELGKRSMFRLVLNGTPLSRNLLDLWAQMEFLSPKILNMGMAEFKNTFCEYVQIKYVTGGQREFIKKYHNLNYLYSIIEPYVFESTLSISVGRQNIDVPFCLSEEEYREHDRLKAKYLDNETLLAMNNNIFLEMTQKMQHNYSCSPRKFEIVDKILQDNDTSKVLIYAKYIDTQSELRIRYPRARIMSLGKHAYGLNLQDYNIVIFFDKTWDYAQREQVEHRVYRVGQQFDCIYYDLTANVGLDRMINDNTEKKQSLLEAFKRRSIQQLKLEL